jgi:hypothetical protein
MGDTRNVLARADERGFYGKTPSVVLSDRTKDYPLNKKLNNLFRMPVKREQI